MGLRRKAKGKAAPGTTKVAGNSRQNKGVGKQKSPKAKTAARASGRGSKKGERRGGRKAGTPNKRTLELREALEQAGLTWDTHPVVMMYKVYTGEITMPVVVTEMTDDGPVNTVEEVELKPDLRVACMREVAQYLEPKRKAVELAGKDGGPIDVTLVDSRTLAGWANDPRNPENRG